MQVLWPVPVQTSGVPSASWHPCLLTHPPTLTAPAQPVLPPPKTPHARRCLPAYTYTYYYYYYYYIHLRSFEPPYKPPLPPAAASFRSTIVAANTMCAIMRHRTCIPPARTTPPNTHRHDGDLTAPTTFHPPCTRNPSHMPNPQLGL
ncbi:uncharacterized protein SETTUDRAFT_38146 [Exserohilum turcica Et28A]|uniref:Uncharacterized protein n=1 Tax=Exserohilum turcicum (strain 28A) TaxID=671987 RepID=R0KHX0_EXST2|nr:uncharacterized protein SETTUDRAFT_38146 [Exserohilum turcica Et28A]EOA88829.1 hypothetical protein SETTUDRAFT_38146 [Exserohilum turcica Et28A]